MRFAPVFALAALVAPLPALAHPKLVSATPAPNSATAPTARVQLVFSERLVAQFSGADVVMTEMPVLWTIRIGDAQPSSTCARTRRCQREAMREGLPVHLRIGRRGASGAMT